MIKSSDFDLNLTIERLQNGDIPDDYTILDLDTEGIDPYTFLKRSIEKKSSMCVRLPYVKGIPDPEPSTLFLVDHHVFSNCDRPDVFTYNDKEEDGNGNVIIGYLVGK